jgi:3',5'-cyclic AMP phosphodiesterase CpdA
MNRRHFLAASSAVLLPQSVEAASANFTFAHITDTHIQVEMKAADGCRMCFAQVRKAKADFALLGGDMVFDAADQSLERAKKVYGLWNETSKLLEMPLHATIGNHDVFGTGPKAGVDKAADGWGKKMFEDKVGPRYHSFDHKGWHFIVLDSIEITPEGSFRGAVDSEQLAWLKTDVAKASGMPTVALVHIPLLSAAPKILNYSGPATDRIIVSNANDVLEVLFKTDLKMVLQGHTHICEKVEYKGCQFITSGAVSGNWWKGERLGFKEGYGIVQVADGKATWSYHNYGFQAVSA